MKVLLDTCVWNGVKKELLQLGYDVIWSGDLDKDPGDIEILRQAFNENRILITLDKDFGELAVFRGYPHKGIVRLVDFSTFGQVKMTVHILKTYENELQSGAIITADPNRIRIRNP